MSDLLLRQHVLDELLYEPSVSAAHIGVVADKGVVTLAGHVASYAEKLAAVSAARRVKGVRAIADEIEVRYPSDKKTADDEIAKRAIDILAWDVTVPSIALQVVVRDGWVTLNGNVDWQYQKMNAEDDIHKLSGVRGVTNNIVVEPRLKSEEVKHKIENALKRHAEIEAKNIRITVNENKVILDGKVETWAERYAVENAAWSAPGVSAVDDRLTIA